MGKKRTSGTGGAGGGAGGGGGTKRAKSTSDFSIPPDAMTFLHMKIFSEWAFLGPIGLVNGVRLKMLEVIVPKHKNPYFTGKLQGKST